MSPEPAPVTRATPGKCIAIPAEVWLILLSIKQVLLSYVVQVHSDTYISELSDGGPFLANET